MLYLAYDPHFTMSWLRISLEVYSLFGQPAQRHGQSSKPDVKLPPDNLLRRISSIFLTSVLLKAIGEQQEDANARR